MLKWIRSVFRSEFLVQKRDKVSLRLIIRFRSLQAYSFDEHLSNGQSQNPVFYTILKRDQTTFTTHSQVYRNAIKKRPYSVLVT